MNIKKVIVDVMPKEYFTQCPLNPLVMRNVLCGKMVLEDIKEGWKKAYKTPDWRCFCEVENEG